MEIPETDYSRSLQLAVAVLIHHGGSYLLQRRPLTKRINPGKLMAVGGRVERGEDFHAAAAREVGEETGYAVRAEDLRFAGLLEFGAGFDPACVSALFVVEVASADVPLGVSNDEGELAWVDEADLEGVLPECIEDLGLYFRHVAGGGSAFALFEREGGKLSVRSLRLA